ncbi:hypothetical protein Tco_0974279 [Tanacetum coccineum]|uniref:Uncharacterized protein n=1 Tax=Tanacetum coccineum TaxID=301880 RepID=A0ABQ5EBA3_9ASTR
MLVSGWITKPRYRTPLGLLVSGRVAWGGVTASDLVITRFVYDGRGVRRRRLIVSAVLCSVSYLKGVVTLVEDNFAIRVIRLGMVTKILMESQQREMLDVVKRHRSFYLFSIADFFIIDKIGRYSLLSLHQSDEFAAWSPTRSSDSKGDDYHAQHIVASHLIMLCDLTKDGFEEEQQPELAVLRHAPSDHLNGLALTKSSTRRIVCLQVKPNRELADSADGHITVGSAGKLKVAAYDTRARETEKCYYVVSHARDVCERELSRYSLLPATVLRSSRLTWWRTLGSPPRGFEGGKLPNKVLEIMKILDGKEEWSVALRKEDEYNGTLD